MLNRKMKVVLIFKLILGFLKFLGVLYFSHAPVLNVEAVNVSRLELQDFSTEKNEYEAVYDRHE